MYYQVKFCTIYDSHNSYLGGFYNSDSYKIICGCCGRVFREEDGEIKNMKILPWIDISDAIKRD